ncbi:MAG: hypothetical protein IJ188_06645 [Clostridia bacterium]|nr:hypothetical protein [Clostridia bacterium]
MAVITKDQNYNNWLQELKTRYQSAQIKAAVSVNRELLAFYWSLGRDIVTKKAESLWGNHFYRTLSRDLHRELPEVKGLSETNLKYMKYFYEMTTAPSIRPQTVDANLTTTIRPQAVDEFSKMNKTVEAGR